MGESRSEYQTTFAYDEENRPTALTYKQSGTAVGGSGNTYDQLGRRTASSTTIGSQTYTSSYTYVNGGHGTGSTTGLVSMITQTYGTCMYTYDDNGNIISAMQDGVFVNYTYDALGQLVRVDDPNEGTWVYTYDQGGNILKKERFAYGDTTTALETVDYVYGDANWKDKATSIGGNAITYDQIGNPLNDGNWTYTWQNGRQLAGMTNGTTTASFVYNKDGLRVQKTVNGVVTRYTLNGKNVAHMTRWSDDLHFFYDAQNRPAVVVYNETAYAYLKNLQGDIVAILDQNGNAVVEYTYDAWGAPLSKTGSMAATLGTVNPFRYRGYVYDEETGLYYLRSRYYNALQCRFVNADAYIGRGYLGSHNQYAYCANSAIVFSDQCGTDRIRAVVNHIGSGVILNANQYRGWLAFSDAFYSAKHASGTLELDIELPQFYTGVYDAQYVVSRRYLESIDEMHNSALKTIIDGANHTAQVAGAIGVGGLSVLVGLPPDMLTDDVIFYIEKFTDQANLWLDLVWHPKPGHGHDVHEYRIEMNSLPKMTLCVYFEVCDTGECETEIECTYQPTY